MMLRALFVAIYLCLIEANAQTLTLRNSLDGYYESGARVHVLWTSIGLAPTDPLNLVLYTEAPPNSKSTQNSTTDIHDLKLAVLNVPNTGMYFWDVPTWLPVRGDYFFVLSVVANSSVRSRGNDFNVRGTPQYLSSPVVSTKCGMYVIPLAAVNRADCRGVMFRPASSSKTLASTPGGSVVYYLEVMTNIVAQPPTFSMFLNYSRPDSAVVKNFTKDVIASSTSIPITNDISVLFEDVDVRNNTWRGSIALQLGVSPYRYNAPLATNMAAPVAGDGSLLVKPGPQTGSSGRGGGGGDSNKPGDGVKKEGEVGGEGGSGGVSAGAIAGIVIGSLLGATVLIGGGLFLARRFMSRDKSIDPSDAAVVATV